LHNHDSTPHSCLPLCRDCRSAASVQPTDACFFFCCYHFFLLSSAPSLTLAACFTLLFQFAPAPSLPNRSRIAWRQADAEEEEEEDDDEEDGGDNVEDPRQVQATESRRSSDESICIKRVIVTHFTVPQQSPSAIVPPPAALVSDALIALQAGDCPADSSSDLDDSLNQARAVQVSYPLSRSL
jgi:hypothetical protein